METNNDTGESAPRDPKLAGAQHKERGVCQTPPGTAQPATVWDYIDSDVALRRGIGYLHARDDFQSESLPATSCGLVDRQASDPSLHAAAKRGFWSDDDLDKTIEVTQPEVESGQLDRSDSQRPPAQLPPADAVISTEMRLTTRELYPERTAGPYSPDSHCQSGLLEGGAAIYLCLDHFLVFMVGLFCLNVYCVCFWGWERREVSVIFVCVCLFCVVAVCVMVPFVIVCSWVCLHSYDGVVCCRIHSLVLFLCHCHLFHIVGRHDIYSMRRYVDISCLVVICIEKHVYCAELCSRYSSGHSLEVQRRSWPGGSGGPDPP